MIHTNWSEINELATKQKNMFSVYVSNGCNYDGIDDVVWNFFLSEISKIYNKGSLEYHLLMGSVINGGLFFFDSEHDACVFYKIFESKEIYASSLYAALYSPVDGCLTENT